ncbi:alpha/beta hydrolase [Reichenbachiella ulvae]|uniref:Alpha/beta hydrolase n=1 Tax=Reichenbachiella ulvae TaxID=2980104 RepID=A0ABT3CSM1_9BACT|nr:alpha/beta hydrolase [Reichenbachiella ulvae]MCV9386581.1 alpha/beta hydrolase [Reichenbachiella ulvae]
MKLRIELLVVLVLCTQISLAQEVIPLWKDGEMPNSKGMELKDSIVNERYLQSGKPVLRAFFSSKQENTGAAVLIIPGGGYHHVTYQISGDQIAKWFNTMGVNAFVLIYRLPLSPDLEQRELGPIQDAEQAMRMIRDRSVEWSIDQDRIGVWGCSAGGHLSAVLSNSQNLDARPDFSILVSPVIDLGIYAHEGSRDNLLGVGASTKKIEAYSVQNMVSSETPPTILFHADDDRSVSPMNSILYYEALKSNKTAASLHIFKSGGHNIALRNNPGATQLWTEICEEWLMESGYLKED